MKTKARQAAQRTAVEAFFQKVVESCPKDDAVLEVFDGQHKNVPLAVKKLLVDSMVCHVSPNVVPGFLQDSRVMCIQSGDNELFWEVHRRIQKDIERYSDFVLISTAIHHKNRRLVEQYSSFMNREVTSKNMAFLILETGEATLKSVLSHPAFTMTKERVRCVKLHMSDIQKATLTSVESKIVQETYRKTHDPTAQSRNAAASRLRDAVAYKYSLIELFVTKLCYLHGVKCCPTDGPSPTKYGDKDAKCWDKDAKCKDEPTKPTMENTITCAIVLMRLLGWSDIHSILKHKSLEFITLLQKNWTLLDKCMDGYTKTKLLASALKDKKYSVAKIWIFLGADLVKVTPGFITMLYKTDRKFLTNIKNSVDKTRLMVGALVENEYAIAKLWIQWGVSATKAIPHVGKVPQSRDMMEFIFQNGGTLDKCSLWEDYSSEIRDNYLAWKRLGLNTTLHGFAGMILNAPLETILVMFHFDPHILNRVFDADNVKFGRYKRCETTLLTHMLLSGKYDQVKTILQLLLQKQHTGWLLEHAAIADVLELWQPVQPVSSVPPLQSLQPVQPVSPVFPVSPVPSFKPASYLPTDIVDHICGYLTVHHVFDIDKETLVFSRDNTSIIDQVSFVRCAHEKGHPDLVAMATLYAQNAWRSF